MGERKIRIIFEPDFKNVDMARAAIGGVCSEVFKDGDSRSKVLDFSMAFTEAMNNAVEHSGSGSIVIELVASGRELLFRMLTEGDRFNPTIEASMPVLGDGADLPEGGFGLAIIQQLVDRVDYEFSDNRNVLTLRKMISDKEEG